MSKQIIIEGQVLAQSGEGLAKLRVECWDKDRISKDEYLGSAITDNRGNFTITLSSKDFTEIGIFDQQPDLFVRIYKDDQLVHSTEDEVMWNWKPSSETLVITVDLTQNRWKDSRKISSIWIAPTGKNWWKDCFRLPISLAMHTWTALRMPSWTSGTTPVNFTPMKSFPATRQNCNKERGDKA